MDRKVIVYIQSLDVSDRTKNALIRSGILTLNELEQQDEIFFINLRGIGARGLGEIRNILNEKESIYESFETRRGKIDLIPQELRDTRITQIQIGARACNALLNAGINNVWNLVQLTSADIMTIPNIGIVTRKEIASVIEAILEAPDMYYARISGQNISTEETTLVKQDGVMEGKGFDFPLIDTLVASYYMKTTCMKEWFGMTRQGISEIMIKRSPKRMQKWSGKVLLEEEYNILFQLAETKAFLLEKDNKFICRCFNNRQDDFVAIFVYENEIKCFFLQDLPTELQKIITDANLHRYTESELNGATEGEIVHILRKPYFLPKYPDKFRRCASFRGLTVDEYSYFVSGNPIADLRSVTDSQIENYLEEKLIDGKVYISSDPQNQWIRSYASRNGYGIKEFVELYGYEMYVNQNDEEETRRRHIEEITPYVVGANRVYLSAHSEIYNKFHTYARYRNMSLNEYISSLGFERTTERPQKEHDSLEKDMEIRQCNGSFEEEIFAKYPLIGSRILSKEEADLVNKRTRIYLDKVLKKPDEKLTLKKEMVITISVINYAKSWAPEKNSSFWAYIALQYGYREVNGTAVHILQSSMEDALKKKNRLFIEDSNGRAFKTTAVVHALSTKKSWMLLFDFLFDFYKNNLNWKVVPNDPLLENMVTALQRKLNGSCVEDAEISISSQVYSFQEGIRKLILFRPSYARRLFEKLIKRIDESVNSVRTPIHTYEEKMCDEWFKGKLTLISNEKRGKREEETIRHEIAVDYSQIQPRFVLYNENSIRIELPDIRLNGETFSSTYLQMTYEDEIVYKQRMIWYGNELGQTLSNVAIQLPDYKGGGDLFKINVCIVCDSKVIYKSAEDLYRKFFVFSGEREIGIAKISRGDYTFVLPDDVLLEGENVILTEIETFKQHGMKAYYAELQEGYTVTVNGSLITFDDDNRGEIHIMPPVGTARDLFFTREGDSYKIVPSHSTCHLIFRDNSIVNQYKIIYNGSQVEFYELQKQIIGQGEDYELPVGNAFSHIQIVDLNKEKLVYDQNFVAISKLKFGFNRECYFSNADYEDAAFSIEALDICEKIYFSLGEDELVFPYLDGAIHAIVPKVEVIATSKNWTLEESERDQYIGDIPQESTFKVTAPSDIDVKFYVDGIDVRYDGQGVVSIGNVLHSLSDAVTTPRANVDMMICGEQNSYRYHLARIFYREGFTDKPKLWLQGNRLYWNHGGKFVGQSGRQMELFLQSEAGNTLTFDMKEDTEYVIIPDQTETGSYKFEIGIVIGGFFNKRKEIIASGYCILGDSNALRFKNQRILIRDITDEYKEAEGHIPIKMCYIDEIEFKSVQETSEGLCPVYSGVLYTDGYNGEKYRFSLDSHVTKRGIKKMMVNPVRIVYVGDNTLCITDCEGDGLYYYSYYDKYLMMVVYALTDHEYTKATRNKYSIADLYSYQTERI